jgi:hypothetical protein
MIGLGLAFAGGYWLWCGVDWFRGDPIQWRGNVIGGAGCAIGWAIGQIILR